MARKKKFDDNNEENIYSEQYDEIINYKRQKCFVLWIKDTSYAIDFKGFGITISSNNFPINPVTKEVTVEHIGEIGSPNFKIISIQ